MMKNISIIGIGKLGLCFALTLEKAGYNILGLDINKDYVNSINNKILKSEEPKVEDYLKQSKNFNATLSLKDVVKFSNVLFVTVATPSKENGRYDHSQINDFIIGLESLGYSSEQKHIVISCTTMPGYCNSIKNRLNDLNYTVSYNPEFIAQGSIIDNQSRPDMVLIGEANQEVGDIIEKIYLKHTINNPTICRMSPIEAEITKLSLNCFLTTKIAYANMIGDIVNEAGGRPDIVLSAIGSDSRVGNKYIKYGYGYGGPCFPRDNRALSIYANDLKLSAKISDATDDSNNLHLLYQMKEIEKIYTKSEIIQFDTVTYKPESTILTESQQFKLAFSLAKKGYTVKIIERNSVIEEIKSKYKDLFLYEKK